MTERKTRSRLTGGIVAVIVLAVCLVVTTVALAYSMISVRDNTFATGGVRINLNDGEPVIRPDEFLFEPGMTVKKDFFIENDSTGTVYYRLYFAGVSGDLADVLEVTVKDGNKTLYSGTPTQLENTQAADDLLTLKGVQASFVVYAAEGAVLMSARSLGEINVQVILEALGGGGNSTTAGARIEDTDPESVRQQLIGVLDAYFEK